ncbi:MAG: protein disulfide-isomerase tigA precursor [Benniella sp.]|nr:MAG: protein disulfide-isomerase tigA precursor [Benniella sp.]
MIHRKSLLLSGVAILLSLAAGVVADSVHALIPETFNSVIGSKPALVEFYAPWCGHCKVYEELGVAFADKNDKVLIAKANADEHKQLGARFGVRGYPTIKWFPNGINSAPEDYKGGRDLDSLSSFVTHKSGVRAMGKRPSAVEVLTDVTFDQTIGKTGKSYLVEFYAPWCGHCKALAPTFEKLGHDFFNEKDVVIAKIDATKEPKTAEKYKVSGYPTIKFFDAEGNVSNYEGSRNEVDFVAFVNTLAGTNRLPGGRLGSKVGRIPQLDEIAVKFAKANTLEEKKQVSTEGIALAALQDSDANAQIYARIFEKAAETPEFLETESRRLQTLIQSGTISLAKVDDLSTHYNILSAFSVDEDASEQDMEADATTKEEL